MQIKVKNHVELNESCFFTLPYKKMSLFQQKLTHVVYYENNVFKQNHYLVCENVVKRFVSQLSITLYSTGLLTDGVVTR